MELRLWRPQLVALQRGRAVVGGAGHGLPPHLALGTAGAAAAAGSAPGSAAAAAGATEDGAEEVAVHQFAGVESLNAIE